VIRVRDNPGVWWLLAILFIGVGAAFVYLGISRATQIEWWQAPLAVLMGSLSVAVGIWWGGRSPLSTVVVTPGEQQVRLVQIGLFGKRVQSIPFGRIEDVVVERQSDDEGGAVARPALLLRDGRKVALSALWRHDVKGISKAVATLRAAIAMKASPFAGIGDLEGSTGDTEDTDDTEVTEGTEDTEITEEDRPS
jgi:hypothetical protein